MAESKRFLKNRAAFLSAVLEGVGDFIVIYDMKARFVAFNQSFQLEFERLFHRRVEVGMSLSDALADAPEAGQAILDRTLRACAGESFTSTCSSAEEPSSQHYESRISPVRDDSGRQIGVLDIIHNVTAGHRAEELTKLTAERARVEAVFECMTEGMIVAEPSGRIVSVNPAARWLHDFASEEEARERLAVWPEFFDVRTLDGSPLKIDRWPIARAIRGHVFTDVEIRLKNRRTGESWIGSYSATKVRDAGGEVILIVISVRDVTARKHAELALCESEERFRNMADTAPVLIWVAGPDKLCTFFNQGWLTFTGRPLEHELGNGWAEVVHPDDLDRCYSEYSSSFDARRAFQMEYRLRRADGEYRWVVDRGVPRFEPGGAFAGYIGSCFDITELKRSLEEALARQKLESVGVLAGGIAHDFNNLLGSVLAEAELALTELAPGRPAFDELQRIRLVALRASEIVRELMIYSGQETGLLELVDISGLVDEMLQLIKISISKHASLETSLGRNLPAVRANAAQIRRVVMNLITNASEALGERDGFIRVNTKHVSLPDGEYVQMEVADSGSGMDAATQARIFDPFYTTRFAGRGLGLAVVQGIIRAHGGAIHLASAPGAGTKFEIRFPCAAQTGQPERDPPRAAAERKPDPAATILLVEDESTIRLTVSRMLRKRGLAVLEAPDGSAAIDLLRSRANEVGIILLDMTIPGSSSREVFQEARRLWPRTKVILTTAYSREVATASLDWPRIDGFLRKPYRIGDLMELIGKVLAR